MKTGSSSASRGGGCLPGVITALIAWLTIWGIQRANGAEPGIVQLAGLAGFVGFSLAAAWGLEGGWRAFLPPHLQRAAQIAFWALLAGLSGYILLADPADPLLATALVGLVFALLIWINKRLFPRPGLQRAATDLGMAAAAGFSIAALAQIRTRFSEEEFFAAVQAAEIGLIWLMLMAANRALEGLGRGTSLREEPIRLSRATWRRTAAVLGLALLGLAGWTIWSYQNSFYGANPPDYPGISESSPAICGVSQAPGAGFETETIRQGIYDRVAANPTHTPVDLGLLALVRPDEGWPEQFRSALLAEARAGLYTGPAYSVKYGQCLAAQRAYFYPRVVQAQAELFSPAEQTEIKAWFAAIHRRALTVEPIDWFYALAFRAWPYGPYENQECGAALLALLESEGLGDPALSQRSRAYLDSVRRGWGWRFRNSDDAYVYQMEWLQHAYFQSLDIPVPSEERAVQSFEWFLRQALPDGGVLRYNHVGGAAPAQTAYLGAALLERGDFLWLAGRSMERLSRLEARPGLELAVTVKPSPPRWGSCLMYGETGLPTRLGPLAPDKIVFRDGWEPGDAYLLLNLRFTGWHRYKATNTVILLDQGGWLTGENSLGEAASWLPVGRSLYRDKRIPRQNLNGLLVRRSGLDAALHWLTGLGGQWAQDPPHYARVELFETGERVDRSRSVIENWHGWRHSREVEFFHGGPIVIIDEAVGPAGEPAGLVWQLEFAVEADGGAPDQLRYMLRGGENPAELVVAGPGAASDLGASLIPGKIKVLQIQPSTPGGFQVASVILSGEWVGASLVWDVQAGVLRIHNGQAALEIDLP